MLYPSEQGQCLISHRKAITDQHEKEIRYLQDVFMAMEQNYIESEYESKLEFQSIWDDVKNKVWRERKMLKATGGPRDTWPTQSRKCLYPYCIL